MNPTYQVIRGGRVSNDQCWLNLAVQRIDSYAGFGLKAAVHISDPRVRFGSTIEFREEELLLLRSGYV